MDYVLQKSDERPGWWVLTDRENMIVVRFKEHRFNDTQEVTHLTMPKDLSPIGVARKMRMIGEWLFENHPELVF